MGNKVASGDAAAPGTPTEKRDSVTSVQRVVADLVSGRTLSPGDHAPTKSGNAYATPDMSALIAALIHSLDGRACSKTDSVSLQQASLLKKILTISNESVKLKSKTLKTGADAMQASQDIIHEIDIAKHHVLHILELAEQVRSMLPDEEAAKLPESPFS